MFYSAVLLLLYKIIEYPVLNSEAAIGKILSEYKRESFYLASKFPGYDLANIDKVEEILF